MKVSGDRVVPVREAWSSPPLAAWTSGPASTRLSTVTVTGAEVAVDPSPRVITAVIDVAAVQVIAAVFQLHERARCRSRRTR